MDKEEELRELIDQWCEGDEDTRFKDAEEVAEEYTDVFMSSENIEDFGYTEEDRDAIYNFILGEVKAWIEAARDIYELADRWDGNGYTNQLEEDEWKEIFENAPEIYKDALSKRAAWVKDWWGEIPDLVWDELEESVDEQLGFIDYDPMSVIDNVIVNGFYGDFDKYKDEDETDEEFIAREEGNCYKIFPEERFIIYSL